MIAGLSVLRRKKRPSPSAMTLAQHLGELRRRLVVCLVALFAAGISAFVFYPEILRLLQAPYCSVSSRCQLYVTGPLDGLSLRVKIAGYGALFFASPVLLWELWRFVTPGLHKREKRYAIPFVATSVVFFAAGVAVAYLSFPHALQFLGSVGGPTLRQLYGPSQYLGLIVAMMAVFGVTFEFPVALVALQLVGVMTPEWLGRNRRWAFMLIVLVAAVVTPSGDPFSMMVLAGPLYVFYEGSILAGRVLRRRPGPATHTTLAC